MKGRPIDQLVYEQLFPKPRAEQPQNFHALLQRYLIPEVRSEVHSFYGHLDTHEAKYPGLDYTHHIHRIRLSRWPWHRRLFRAIDALRLTPFEIASLTKWEGTLWAKERYEREQGVTIRDTAADDMLHWAHDQSRPMPGYFGRPQPPKASSDPDLDPEAEVEVETETEEVGSRIDTLVERDDAGMINDNDMDDEDDDDDNNNDDDGDVDADADADAYTDHDVDEHEGGEMREDERPEVPEGPQEPQEQDIADESEGELESVGIALNQRLRAQAARREAGDTSAVMDEEWEQWLKNAIEAGEFPYLIEHLHDQSSRRSAPMFTIPPRMLVAARSGQWHEIPQTLHDMIRCALDSETRRRHQLLLHHHHHHHNLHHSQQQQQQQQQRIQYSHHSHHQSSASSQQPPVSQPRTGLVNRLTARTIGTNPWRRMYGV